MSSKEVWYNSKELKVGVALLFLTGIATVIYDKFTAAALFSTLSSFGNLLWGTINFKIHVLWLITSLIALPVVFWIYLKKVESRKNKIVVSEQQPVDTSLDFLNYKSDILIKWKWSWAYENYFANYRIINLRPHCLKCDTLMLFSKTEPNTIICLECSSRYDKLSGIESKYRIKTLIESNIHRKFDDSKFKREILT